MPRKPESPESKQGRQKPAHSRAWRVFGFLFKWMAVLGIWAGVAAGAILVILAFDLPDVSTINHFARRPSLTFVSSDGQPVATYGDQFAGAVELNEMSPWLPKAVLATEDRRFYRHSGIDFIGLARATWVNLRAGRIVQGGSTITQQLAKNVFLTSERSYKRKVQEVMLAFWLERRFTKDQILTIYLNRVYLGAGTYGVEAASRRYFGKPSRQLTPHEAAVIAGLLKAPSRYSPASDLERAKGRAEEVLGNLAEAGYMTAEEARAAGRQPLRIALNTQAGRGARYFTDWLADAVPGFVGFVDRDLIVVTTLDARLQRAAEVEIARALARDGEKANAGQAALVAMTPDGAVRAMIGGKDYADSQFNRAASSRRQPGSAFKPFVFLAAVEAGMRPDEMIADGPVSIGEWSPRNFDNVLKGQITAREALARSVNTATVRVAQRAGIDRVTATASRLGIASPLRRDFATALGASEVTPFELTAAFAPFANGGNSVLPYAIEEIRDGEGNVLYRRTSSGAGPVLQRAPLAAMNDMMQAVVREGTGRAASLDRPTAGKTGTSQEYRDAWFVGFTADYVAGVWIGNDDGEPMERITGGSLPARIWRAFMLEAHRGLPSRPLPLPAGSDAPVVAGTPGTGGGIGGLLESLFRRAGAPAPALPEQRPPTHDPRYRPPGFPPVADN
jgi:penicillin-binding protein 1A